MPLEAGRSKSTVLRNAKEMMASGHPRAQAWAAAYSKAGLSRREKNKGRAKAFGKKR